MVMARAFAACAADRVREASRVGEACPSRIAHLGGRARIEIAKHAPEQDVAREMEWLLERIVGGSLVGGDEAEGGAPREQRMQHLVAHARV